MATVSRLSRDRSDGGDDRLKSMMEDPLAVIKMAAGAECLSDETRVKIMALLQQKPAGATALSRALDMSRTEIESHLDTLREAGLVTAKPRGRNGFTYAAASHELYESITVLLRAGADREDAAEAEAVSDNDVMVKSCRVYVDIAERLQGEARRRWEDSWASVVQPKVEDYLAKTGCSAEECIVQLLPRLEKRFGIRIR